MAANKSPATVLLKDKEWTSIEGQLCLVTEFVPIARMKNGEITGLPHMPYASVQLKREDSQEVKGFICHKVDFATLWSAFNERGEMPGTQFDHHPGLYRLDGLGEEEEVALVWTRTNYLSVHRLFRRYLPKLITMVRPKGAFELQNRTVRPDLHGLARHKAMSPLVTWTPDVMKI